MFPIGLQHIFGYNLQKSTAAYERLVGDSAAVAAAAAKAVQRGQLLDPLMFSGEEIERANKVNIDST